jgi:glycosyltransferase involved in cell wall biosynthesis
MTRIALLSSEPIRPLMAGIGIRYLEIARRLPAFGFEVLLVSPASPETPEDTAALGLPAAVAVQRFERGRLAEILAGCAAAVAQGQLGNDLLLELPGLPAALDLYDPWLVENLSYVETLGLDPFRNDHATWVLQLSRGDFFLCSSEEQRTFYLGFLAALGRVNPERVASDPDLATLIAPVPFGVPDELPAHRPVLPPRRPGERRILFGGLYDWYDPWTLLDALARAELVERPWTLLLIRNPNPEATPQRLFAEVEARCRRLGWWGSRVEILDWIPAERRYDLLRDVDLLVAPHRPSLETRLSLRTRFLDALAAGCPVITSEGGTIGRLLAQHHAGWVVPPGDPAALARAVVEALDRPDLLAAQREGARRLLADFTWERALAPLVRFCREPRIDPTKERFAYRPATVAPPDRLGFRIQRRLRRFLAGAGA